MVELNLQLNSGDIALLLVCGAGLFCVARKVYNWFRELCCWVRTQYYWFCGTLSTINMNLAGINMNTQRIADNTDTIMGTLKQSGNLNNVGQAFDVVKKWIDGVSAFGNMINTFRNMNAPFCVTNNPNPVNPSGNGGIVGGVKQYFKDQLQQLLMRVIKRLILPRGNTFVGLRDAVPYVPTRRRFSFCRVAPTVPPVQVPTPVNQPPESPVVASVVASVEPVVVPLCERKEKPADACVRPCGDEKTVEEVKSEAVCPNACPVGGTPEADVPAKPVPPTVLKSAVIMPNISYPDIPGLDFNQVFAQVFKAIQPQLVNGANTLLNEALAREEPAECPPAAGVATI